MEIPLDDREEASTREEIPLGQGVNAVGPGPRLSRLLLLFSICALTVRIELFRQIYRATECTTSSVEVTHAPESSCRVTYADMLTQGCCAPRHFYLRFTTLPEASTNRKGRKSRRKHIRRRFRVIATHNPRLALEICSIYMHSRSWVLHGLGSLVRAELDSYMSIGCW